jgi:hypothetical protein
MNAHKVCPTCKAQAPIDAATCASCGHTYRTNFAPQTTAFYPPPSVVSPRPPPPVVNQPAAQSPIPVPVVIHRPSAMPGPICPRCASPYVNPAPSDRGLGPGRAMIVCLAATLASLCFYPLLAVWFAYPAMSFVAPAWLCHTCGLYFVDERRPRFPAWLWLAAFLTAAALLVVQIILWRSRASPSA